MLRQHKIHACRLPGLTEMSAQEVLDKLNEQWIDSRYKLCLVPTKQPTGDKDDGYTLKPLYSNEKNTYYGTV